MQRSIVLIAIATLAISLSSCTTTYVAEPGPKWYSYGALSIFKKLGDENTFLAKGKSAKSSGITILESSCKTLSIDVSEIGEASFMTQGMFRVEVDDKGLQPKEEVARMATDPTWVRRRGGRVTYALPAYYQKIVINFYDVDLKGFIFKVDLLDE